VFSAKIFNSFTAILAILFFLSAIISTVSDIQKEASIKLEFSKLVNEVNAFNVKHESLLNSGIDNEEIYEEQSSYNSSKEALVDGYKNYYNADSYYSEGYGVVRAEAYGFPLYVELWIKTILYKDGDFIQEVMAKEANDTFGGKKGGMIIYYNAEEDLVYRNYTWKLQTVNGEYEPVFNSAWTTQATEEYMAEFGGRPGKSIYEINNRTAANEMFYRQVKDSKGDTTEHHIQYMLNPTLSTKLYKNFISYALGIVKENLVKTLTFEELTVSAIVDSQGNLKTARYKEQYAFSIYVERVNLHVSAKATSEMNYNYISFNQPINYEKPQVSL
jgi:hypothetical protein